jgi:hypothetical protein
LGANVKFRRISRLDGLLRFAKQHEQSLKHLSLETGAPVSFNLTLKKGEKKKSKKMTGEIERDL